MIVAVAFIFWACAIYVAYVSAVFSVSTLVDPEQIDNLLPQASATQRDFLRKLVERPYAFSQIAAFFKWIAVIATAVVAFVGSSAVTTQVGASLTGAFFGLFVSLILASYLATEILPRRKSLQVVDRRLLRILPALRLLFVWSEIYTAFHHKLTRRATVVRSPDTLREDIVERAIESLADKVGEGRKLVEESEKEMIENIFHLSVAEVREIMSPRVDIVGIEIGATLDEVRRIARESEHSRYPVYRESTDHILGVLHVKDIFHNPPENSADFLISAYMRPPYFVPDRMKVDALLAAFKSKKVHIAVVIDEFGGTAGLATMEDILEEIVGDIQDEHDRELAPLTPLGDGEYEVDANMPVRDLAEALNLDYNQDGFETVAGLIYDLVGSVPSEKEEVRWNEVVFIVKLLDGQRISRVSLRLPRDKGGLGPEA